MNHADEDVKPFSRQGLYQAVYDIIEELPFYRAATALHMQWISLDRQPPSARHRGRWRHRAHEHRGAARTTRCRRVPPRHQPGHGVTEAAKSPPSSEQLRELGERDGFDVEVVTDCYVVDTLEGPRPYYHQILYRKR